MATETLPEHIGPYQVVGLLGKGGMGSVYKAFKPPLRRYVAVKIIKAEFTATPGALERFRREAELASDLKHPNIVTVFDYEEVPNGDSYIVTELIEGGQTLRDRLLQGPLTLDEIADILRQTGSALDYAFDKSHIVHRDIKPTNIFLEEGKRVALGDFGIAKSITSDTALTAVNQGVGTPDYMSPEQAMGEDLDRRSDIYSLGVVLYEMLTGRVPFKGDTPISVVMAHIQKPVPDVRQTNPNFAPAIQHVVSKAMAKRKEDRYAIAAEMTQAFGAAIKQVSSPSSAHAETMPITTGSVPFLNTQLTHIGQLENQGRYQEAFDRLEELQRQFPQEQEVARRYQSYRNQGYLYRGATNPNISGPAPTIASTPLIPSRPTGQPTPYTPAPYVTAPKKSSSLPMVLGGVAAILVIAAIAIIALLATGNSTEKNATATAQAIAALPTITPVPTNTPVPAATRAATATTAPTPTIAPPTPTVAPSVKPVEQALQLAKDGDALFNQRNYKDAAEKYKAAIKLDPTVVTYYEFLARSYYNLDQYADMEAPAKKAVELQPTDAYYQYLLGLFYYQTDRNAEAEKNFREAIRLKPGESLYQRYLSNALYEQSRYGEAEAAAKKAIELNSGEPDNHNALGRALFEQNKYPEAEKEFRTAASQNSSSAVFQTNVAVALNSQSKYQEAETEARKAVKLDNNYAFAYRALSIALRNQDKNDEAFDTAKKAADLNPKDSSFPAHAAAALINLKRYSEAETYARKAVQLEPTSAFAQNALGDALYDQGKYKESLDAYNAAVKNFSKSYVYLTNLADTYAKLNDFAKARDSYNRALAIKGDYKPALDGLAAIKDK